MKLSIIIVHYKTYELTVQTIESVLSNEFEQEYEIILVDNCSKDGSIEQIEEKFSEIISKNLLIIIKNSRNLGFAKGNNIGIKKSKGKYILLLNSDTQLLPSALTQSIDKIESDDKIGILGGKVILPNGQLDHACKRGFPTPLASLYYFLGLGKLFPKSKIFSKYTASYIDEDEESNVDAVMGAFLLIPRTIVFRVGLLHEGYFMYGEDIDLCYQVKKIGYEVKYYPIVKIIHHKGGSSKALKNGKIKKNPITVYEFHRAMQIFYDRNYKNKYPIIVTYIIYMAIWSRYYIEKIRTT